MLLDESIHTSGWIVQITLQYDLRTWEKNLCESRPEAHHTCTRSMRASTALSPQEDIQVPSTSRREVFALAGMQWHVPEGLRHVDREEGYIEVCPTFVLMVTPACCDSEVSLTASTARGTKALSGLSEDVDTPLRLQSCMTLFLSFISGRTFVRT